MVGDFGIADGSEEDGIETRKLRQTILGHQAASLPVVVAAPRELGEPEVRATGRGQRLKDFASLRDNLRPHAVAANHCQVVLRHRLAVLAIW